MLYIQSFYYMELYDKHIYKLIKNRTFECVVHEKHEIKERREMMMIGHVTDLQTGEVENVNYFNINYAWVQFQR